MCLYICTTGLALCQQSHLMFSEHVAQNRGHANPSGGLGHEHVGNSTLRIIFRTKRWHFFLLLSSAYRLDVFSSSIQIKYN